MANNVKFLLGYQDVPFLLTGSLGITAVEDNVINYITKTAQGQIHYNLTKGFKLPFEVNVEITNLFSASDITISKINSLGAKVAVKTISGGTLQDGPLRFSKNEVVIFESTAEITFNARESKDRNIG